MGSSESAIFAGATLLMTLGIIAVMFFGVRLSRSATIGKSADIAKLQAAAANSRYAYYDDKDIEGHALLDAMHELNGTPLDNGVDSFSFELVTGEIKEAFEHMDNEAYENVRLAFPEGYAESCSNDPSDANYINADGIFHTVLIWDGGTVSGIRAVQSAAE